MIGRGRGGMEDTYGLGPYGVTLGGSTPSVRIILVIASVMDKIYIMNKARIEKRRARDVLVEKTAKELFEKHKDEPIFLSGIVLYWAEGTRLNKNYRKYQLAFTNSDANLVNFYCNFLQKYFKNINQSDWRAGLFLYPDIDVKKAISYWSKVLNISNKQFIKPQILKSRNIQARKLRFGTCCLYINSKDACLVMQGWIESLCELMRR